MPVISTAFERVGVYLISPFSPKSDRGNRYILAFIKFATRYVNAIVLPEIDALHVAEGLIEIFSRVGLPKEFLRTTPYHAMANRLVEKFNGTLKMMLKMMCQEKPRSWDKYLAPLLFANRQVPQASLDVSPFQPINSRHVRGPLTVLKKLWSNEDIDREIRTTYTYLVDYRNRLEETCKLAYDELERACAKQKTY